MTRKQQIPACAECGEVLTNEPPQCVICWPPKDNAFDFIYGYCDASGVYSDDWPDGAYEAIHVEAVEQFNGFMKVEFNKLSYVDWYEIASAYNSWLTKELAK